MRTVLAISFALLLPISAAAASEKTSITVEVKNQYEKPVDNAAVILDFLGSHQITKLGKRKPIHWEARTNLHGIAHFPPIPQGKVQVQVITSKYQTFGQVFDIDTEQKTIPIKLNPPQGQYSAHEPTK